MAKENLKDLKLILRNVFEDEVDVVVANAYEEFVNRGKINENSNKEDYKESIERINNSINPELLRKIKANFTLLTNEEIIEVLNDSLFNEETSRRGCVLISKELCTLVYDLFEQNYSGEMLLDACSYKGNFLAYAVQRMSKEGAFKSITSYNKSFNDTQIVNMIGDILKYGNEATANAINVDFLKEKNKTFCNQGFVLPPFGIRLLDYDEQVKTIYKDIFFTNRNSSEWLYVDKLINLPEIIKDKNKTIAIVSLKALYSNYDNEYRNKLINDGLIEGVIELPVGALNGLALKTAILILSTGNKSIKMLDASKYYTKNRNTIALNNQEIYRDYKNNKCTTINNKDALKLNRLIPSQLIVDNDYEGELLKDIAEVFVGCQYTKKNFEEFITNENEAGSILTSSDIDNGIINWNLLTKINFLDRKMLKYAVNKNDIIMTSKSTKVKISVVDVETNKPVIVTGGMIIIRLKNNNYNPTYIKGFFDSEKGKEVLASIQKGSIITNISINDLMNVKIPSISNQEEYSKKYNELLMQIQTYKSLLKKCEDELNNLMEEYK